MENRNGTCSEEERMRRNIAKNERKRLYKERVRKEKEPIVSMGCDISTPMWVGRKVSNELYVTILCQAKVFL